MINIEATLIELIDSNPKEALNMLDRLTKEANQMFSDLQKADSDLKRTRRIIANAVKTGEFTPEFAAEHIKNLQLDEKQTEVTEMRKGLLSWRKIYAQTRRELTKKIGREVG